MLPKGINSLWRSAADGIVSLLLPCPCRICGALLEAAGRLPLCNRCLESLAPLAEPLCQKCGRPLPFAAGGSAANPLCLLCRRGVYAFDRARSFAVYDETMVRAVTILKYEAVTSLGNWFAARLGDVVKCDSQLPSADVVLPVPLDASRLRRRGHNQAELIAGPLARRLKVPAHSDWMRRTRPRPDRLKLTRRERWHTVRGAFEVAGRARVDKLRVLLVDDVFTTGATLDACARALLLAGASNVYGLTVARVVSDWLSLGAMREKR